MTIAAGFICRDGVLLCADTEQTGWAMKVHASKLCYFKCDGGKLAFAYAGNSEFAISAIQKCRSRLESVSEGDLLDKLESILDQEYRRNVLDHPDHANLHYQLLIARCFPSTAQAKLFATTQTVVREVDGYECIGVGDYLAHYLIRPFYKLGMEERPTLSLAAYMLANVKGYVSGCGGQSEFLEMRNDGTITRVETDIDHDLRRGIEWLEHHAKEYDYLARNLLFAVVDPDINQDDFESAQKNFSKYTRDLRNRWLSGAPAYQSFAKRMLVSGTDSGE